MWQSLVYCNPSVKYTFDDDSVFRIEIYVILAEF